MLMRTIPESGWYDCDLPWKTNPVFGPARPKERMIGVATMSAVAADTYFNAGLRHVFISGVLPGDLHFQNIQSRMKTKEIVFRAIWLTCGEEMQRQRLIGRDGHDKTFVDVSEYLSNSGAGEIDCSSNLPGDAVHKIVELFNLG